MYTFPNAGNKVYACICAQSSLVEDSSSITKSSITLPISISLLCHHGTNDMNCFRVAWIRVANKGCSHIATNLGSHKAQTQWVEIYSFIMWCL